MLEAFIEQTYGDIEGAKKSDREADLRGAKELEIKQNNFSRGLSELQRSQSIKDYISIPSQNPEISNPPIEDSGRHELDKIRIRFDSIGDDLEIL